MPLCKRRERLLQIAISAIIVFLLGCDEGVAQYRDGAATTAPVASQPAPSANPDMLRDRRKANKGDTPVYVDGELVGALRHGELPSTLKKSSMEGRKNKVYNVAQYLESIGVNVDELKAVHFSGSGRVAAMDGDELRKHRDTLAFSFTKRSGTAGKAVMVWHGKTKIHASSRIDKVAAVYVFWKKPAPAWNRTEKAFYWDDGTKVEGVAYVGKTDQVQGRAHLRRRQTRCGGGHQ